MPPKEDPNGVLLCHKSGLWILLSVCVHAQCVCMRGWGSLGTAFGRDWRPGNSYFVLDLKWRNWWHAWSSVHVCMGGGWVEGLLGLCRCMGFGRDLMHAVHVGCWHFVKYYIYFILPGLLSQTCWNRFWGLWFHHFPAQCNPWWPQSQFPQMSPVYSSFLC